MAGFHLLAMPDLAGHFHKLTSEALYATPSTSPRRIFYRSMLSGTRFVLPSKIPLATWLYIGMSSRRC